MNRILSSILLLAILLSSPLAAQDGPRPLDRKAKKELAKLAEEFWKARPPHYFADRDEEAWAAMMKKVEAWGELPEGELDEVVKVFWKPAKKLGARVDKKSGGKGFLKTPYGDAWFYIKGKGRKKGLVLGLHGGGEGAGSADGPAGTWSAKNCIGMYPQGIRLVHDTWNTVHGERFILSMIEIAKCQHGIDPDRVYSMGFSMGGTGSWFAAGRHPDLLAGSSPCAGVLMAKPKSQLPRKEQIEDIQHGIVPNVRNLAMYYYIGLADVNCMPGTYLYVWDVIKELRRDDPGGYENLHFQTYPGLAHAFPAGEPQKGIKFLEKQKRMTYPEKVVWEFAAHPYPRPDKADKVKRHQKHHFYWIRCTNPQDRQLITCVRKGNEFTLEYEGRPRQKLDGISIMLNGDMIDPQKEVVVTYLGDEVYRGKPKPTLEAFVSSFNAKVDTKMVFDRRIDLSEK